MAYDESDHQRELEEEAILESFREWFPEALWERSAEVAAKYLQTYGDAVQERIVRALAQARQHLDAAVYESAVLRAFTAIELIVGYLLFRPLLLSVFLSEELAARIVREVFEGAAKRERALLPAVLAHWEIRLDGICLSGGQRLWPYITESLRPLRNGVAHDGASASPEEARLAIEAADLLLQSVVRPVFEQLGFTLDKTGKWSEIRRHTHTQRFEARSPFKR